MDENVFCRLGGFPKDLLMLVLAHVLSMSHPTGFEFDAVRTSEA
jgi:hypothetical protein